MTKFNVVKKTQTKNRNEIFLVENNCKNFDKTVLIIGVVHGEEPQGKFLIENYLLSLRAKRSNPKNKMLFIPCLNPEGMAVNRRQNANGVDLNRNFPTKNWGVNEPKGSDYYGGIAPASEIETKFVVDILNEYKPDIILTIHAPYKVVNYDGPAEKIAQKISEIIGYQTSNDIGYPTPGSFGTYSGVERNIPTLTLELDEEIDVNELIEPVNKVFDYLSNI